MYPIMILAIESDEDRLFMHNLYEDHYPAMLHVALQILRDRTNADDAISDACMALIQNIEILHTLTFCRLRSYIVSTMRSSCFDLLRKQQRQRQHIVVDNEAAYSDVESQEPDLDAALIRDANTEALRKGLRRLNERDRNMLEMKYYLQKTDAEIAAIWGMKPASVRQYLTNARRRLARLITEGEDPV